MCVCVRCDVKRKGTTSITESAPAGALTLALLHPLLPSGRSPPVTTLPLKQHPLCLHKERNDTHILTPSATHSI